MVNRTSLACYTVRVMDKETGDKKPLGQLSSSKDLLTVFTEYLDYLSSERPIDNEQQVMRNISQYKSNGWTISGIIQTGEYGLSTEIRDVNAKSLSYQKQRFDAEMMPYYFLAYLPSEYNVGVILLQRRSSLGVRTVFFADFIKFVANSYQNVAINVSPLMPRQLLEEYLRTERITSLRFTQFEVPQDLVVAHDINGHIEEEGTVELRIAAKRGGSLSPSFFDKVSKVLNGDLDVTEMVEIRNFEYEQVKVEINVKGKKKTVNLSDVDKMNSYHDISREVKIDNDGFPVFDSIDKIAQELLDGMLEYMGIKRENAR